MGQIYASSKSEKGPGLAQRRHQHNAASQASAHEDVLANVEDLS